MGQPQGRKSKKHTNGNHPLHRTRNYGRDVDQIHADLADKNKTALLNTTLDEDKPGLGAWYCLECARWFIDENALTKHKTTKTHKRRSCYFVGALTQIKTTRNSSVHTERGRSGSRIIHRLVVRRRCVPSPSHVSPLPSRQRIPSRTVRI
jgi:bud site selection protein 20